MNTKKYLFLFLFLCGACQGVSHAQDDIKDYQINNRGDSPYDPLPNYNTDLTDYGQNASRYPIQFARHHIIPFNVIRDFYNTVAQRRETRSMRKFFLAFASIAPNWRGNRHELCVGQSDFGFNIGVAIQFARAIAFGWSQMRADVDSVRGFDSFNEFYTWMPWNLFIGPEGAHRLDDPGAGFESQAAGVVGTNYLRELSELHQNMLAYIRGNESLLPGIVNQLTDLSTRGRTVFRFNRDNWGKKNGRYFIKKPPPNDPRRLTSSPLESSCFDPLESRLDFNYAPPSTFVFNTTLF